MLSDRQHELSPPHAGTLYVFTFKKGLLSRLAHDLRVSVPHFDVELREGRVRARFDVQSACVDGVVEGERVDPARFSKQDTDIIERNMRDGVLNAARFPAVELEGEVQPTVGDAWILHGRLTMVGRTHEVDVPVVRVGSDLVAEVELKPSLWGIAPFTTMGGAIGIEDRWRVRVKLALGGHTPPHLLRQAGVVRWGG
ncbi:MAG TPA: YceI family protein [Polyangiaceae bacterium]